LRQKNTDSEQFVVMEFGSSGILAHILFYPSKAMLEIMRTELLEM